jgi:hypothetical protein
MKTNKLSKDWRERERERERESKTENICANKILERREVHAGVLHLMWFFPWGHLKS